MKYKNLVINNADDSFITIVDDEGNEELCQIIFTLESEELNKKYVVFSRVADVEKYYNDEDSDEQIEVGAACYVEGPDGTGDLQEIETDEEWELIEDALGQFDEECCEGECECDCDHEHCHCEDGTEVCECDDDCDCEEGHCCCCHHEEEK